MNNQHMARRGTLVALLAVPALVLSACGGSAGQSGAAGSSDRATQMYAWVSHESDREQWQAFVDAATKANPDFRLTFDGPSFNDYFTKVKTRMLGDDAPCILTTQAARAQELDGILSPLDDLMKAEGVDASMYNAAMMEGMTVNGSVVALPYDAEPDVLYYNRALFAEAGLAEPGLDYTTEQFLSDAKALTGDGRWGLAVKPAMMDNAPGALAHAFGGAVSDGGAVTLAEPDYVDGVQFAFDLVAVEGVAQAPNAADGDGPSQGAFTSGTAAMLFDGPWMYGTFEAQLGDDLGVAVVPSPTGTPLGVVQGSGFGIAKNCPDKEAAFKVLKQLVAPEVIGAVASVRGTVPSVASQMDQWAEGKPEDSVAAIEALLDNGTPLVTTPAWNQMTTSFIQYSPEGFRGTRTAQDILTSISQAAG
ncbi:sugar ABC transporter substrate-binding protein [Actinomyces sp. B33]|uniref:ABC transporter substrate-binding protein n=1 Tax=Actinomyces sp. B33 TaxID=2942131 RepID=UPI00233FF27C|nr:sugar ABC transporter substrate-binding protein [Actinomyces sp. B33]MDC4232495.1 sugar ABC transporter substrate-binding protein [Actinomyces sp. B33]